MENEMRDKEGPNPMDAVKGKSAKTEGVQGKRLKKDKEASKSNKVNRPNLLIQVLNGEILTRDFVLNNLTFVFFILFLLLLMVAKGYYGKQLQKDITTLQSEVDAQTAEYIENKARLEELTTRYRLKRVLEPRGLKESVNPVKVIRIKAKKK